MKKAIFLAMCLFTCFVFSCKNDDDGDLTAIEQLPPQTNVGANRAGCLVNGEVLIPKGNANQTILRCQYALRNGEYFFILGIANNESEFSKSIVLRAEKFKLEEGKSYKFLEKPEELWAEHSIESGLINYYDTDLDHSGILSITRLDEEQRIISGTFSFTAVNDQGETVEVTDGRFDMRYIP